MAKFNLLEDGLLGVDNAELIKLAKPKPRVGSKYEANLARPGVFGLFPEGQESLWQKTLNLAPVTLMAP